MQRITTIFLLLFLASMACSLNFNPPPLSLTPQTNPASATPLLINPTQTFTVVPPSATPIFTATETLAAPSPTAAAQSLTVEQVRNASLTITGSDGKIRTIGLKDGKYQQGSDPAQEGYVVINLGDKIAFGDLNGDGVADAAISMGESYGGTGVFVSVVALMDMGGQPQAVASMLIEDRAMVNDISIENGGIFIQANVHGPNDPSCCPAQASTQTYRLVGSTLQLAHFTTKVMDGRERIITIESPLEGTQVGSSFVIKGSVTVAPFENNLGYKVYQQGVSEPLNQGGFVIHADEMGGPGTFELPVDLTNTPFHGPLRVEIADYSAANGAYLALSTVYLLLK